MSEQLDAWLDRNHPELTAIRRDIHAHPELAFQEHRTSALVADKLRGWGIAVVTGVGGTGVVGTVEGRLSGARAIGLRADMDALALDEKTGKPHASTHAGRMHACGHDGHTTMLLGAAKYLAEHRNFAGKVHLIFQPAEELASGALAMLADGLFDRFPCDAIYSLHNTAGMPLGQFATRTGAMLSAPDHWTVTFRGTGGHGGLAPERTNDITYAQAHFVLGLQGIVGRNIAPHDTAVISVGHIAGGKANARNVVPSELVVSGTARSYSPEVRDLIERRIEELARLTAQSWGCAAEFVYDRGPPALVNEAARVRIAVAAASEAVGRDNVDDNLPPTTGGEDFAEMMQLSPGALMRIGNGCAPDGSFAQLHSPLYDFNDDALRHGVAYWVEVVHQELGPDSELMLEAGPLAGRNGS